MMRNETLGSNLRSYVLHDGKYIQSIGSCIAVRIVETVAVVLRNCEGRSEAVENRQTAPRLLRLTWRGGGEEGGSTHMLYEGAALIIMALNIPDEAADVAGRLDGGEVGGERVAAVGGRPVVFCGRERCVRVESNQRDD